MDTRILDGIHSPADVKKLDVRQLEFLCADIREFLIEKVSQTGGHLSSNLGVVELTVALHRVFDTPHDAIVFDVGHQCYTHKLLTGRREGFDRLRMENGMSGFPCPDESPHDVFEAGHGSTALSAAIGLAQAKRLKGEKGKVIAIVGDGAFTGGMVYEALNNAGGLGNLILVLNDNKMSISKSDGALANYFTRLRTSPSYYKAKTDVKSVLDNTPLIGEGMIKGIQSMKTLVRRSIYNSTFFEDLGFEYMGPADGHDVGVLCNLFLHAKHTDSPLFVHIETVKGKGFRPAEQNPGAFHGVSAFNARHITDPDVSPADSFSTQFGQELSRMGDRDSRICAITAAMKYGTGLQYFKKAHLPRFFDVGIAEEHAVTFAAGLARGGMLPVVSIYSTFLQRSYDQIIHDVMLQKLNVLFAIDRAGLVPGDGETHQGIYDAAYLSQHSGLPVVSPCNYAELRFWLRKLLEEYDTPRALRYPRGDESSLLANKGCSGCLYDKVFNARSAKTAIVTYGTETGDAMQAAGQLEDAGIPCDVYQLVQINPLPEGFAHKLLRYSAVLFAEEGIRRGGIGEHLATELLQLGFAGKYRIAATPETGIDHATVPQLKQAFGLDAAGLAKTAGELAE